MPPVTRDEKAEKSTSEGDGFTLNLAALKKQKDMLRNMSSEGLKAKWQYLRNCSGLPSKRTKARSLARKIEEAS
jgi:hypothetical protein